jgi:hypothetical protein
MKLLVYRLRAIGHRKLGAAYVRRVASRATLQGFRWVCKNLAFPRPSLLVQHCLALNATEIYLNLLPGYFALLVQKHCS